MDPRVSFFLRVAIHISFTVVVRVCPLVNVCQHNRYIFSFSFLLQSMVWYVEIMDKGLLIRMVFSRRNTLSKKRKEQRERERERVPAIK